MVEKYQRIWETGKWTNQARDVLAGINQFPEDSKIIMILRHSHRKSSVSAEKISRLKLTKQGHKIARIFGSMLPKNRPIRLYHSIVERCQETAQGILEGFTNQGGKGKIHGVLDSLYDLGADSSFIIKQAIKLAGEEFLNRWSSETFPTHKMKPLSSYSEESAREIWSLIDNAPKNGIDIHVSHDLSIMGFRLGWFGLQGNDWWVSFMGGFAMSFNEGDIILLDRGKLMNKDFPEWWN